MKCTTVSTHLACLCRNDLAGIASDTAVALFFLLPNEVILVDPEEMTIARTEINPVWSDAEQVVVRDELPEGWLLVTSSLSYAADGSKVEIQEPSPDAEMGEIKAARKDSTEPGRPGGKRKPGA